MEEFYPEVKQQIIDKKFKCNFIIENLNAKQKLTRSSCWSCDDAG